MAAACVSKVRSYCKSLIFFTLRVRQGLLIDRTDTEDSYPSL